jgi:hypothetical protein
MDINRKLLSERRSAMATRQRSSSSKKKGRKPAHAKRRTAKRTQKPMHEEMATDMPEKAEMEG